MVSRFEEVFRQMWINNGNEVSKIYAGTGAIQGGSKVRNFVSSMKYHAVYLKCFLYFVEKNYIFELFNCGQLLEELSKYDNICYR